MADATSSQAIEDGKYPLITVGGSRSMLCSKLQRPQHTHLGGTRDGQGDLTGSTRKQPAFAKRSEGRAGGIVDSVLGQLLSLLSCALAPLSLSLSNSHTLAAPRWPDAMPVIRLLFPS